MKRPRTVFGRLRNVEVGEELWNFELSKEGLRARRRGRSKKSTKTLGFPMLAAGGAVTHEFNGVRYTMSFDTDGLVIAYKAGPRKPKETKLTFAQICNLSNPQPVLFPE